MRKRSIFVITFIALLIILYIIYTGNPHKPIKVWMVKSAIAWRAKEDIQAIQLNKEELAKLVKLFNAADVDIKNTYFEGKTPSWGISLDSKFEFQISINEATAEKFEIQRTILFKRVAYWIKSRELYDYVKGLTSSR